MVSAPSGAAIVLVRVAVIDVALTTTTLLTDRPVPGAVMFTVLPVVKLVPVRVTFVAEPRRPELGTIEVSVGSAGATTVNVPALVVPAGVVIVTVLAERVAVGEMVKIAVTVVAFTTVTALTVMSAPAAPPDTVTAVVPVRSVPVMVTGTTVP